ncbi:MAG TPA: isochorismatase family cysteine hydrolase [Gaiellaceae bacterium]|nr:isochorismatase family cysteine hydrolase [Gaiellaceae bacterium]
MKDCLLAVDLFSDLSFEDGDRLLASLEARQEGFVETLARARSTAVPVVYANDTFGVWNGDRSDIVRRGLEGRGGHVLESLQPTESDAFVVKPRYSAFDLTPLELVLSTLDVERLLLMGTTTEMCVAQTAIDARERGYLVTVIVTACATPDERLEQIALEYLEQVAGARLAESFELAVAERDHERGPVSRPSLA